MNTDMKEPIITEVYISPNTSETMTDDGERKTGKMLGLIHLAVDITVGIGQRKNGLKKQNNTITGSNKTLLISKMNTDEAIR
jgi:hypothetical protein